MREVQRFNKVLKSGVLLGDVILLNFLLWGFNFFWGNRFWCSNCGSILQGMTLITLCYLLCNAHSGVILHRPVVRTEQIMLRLLRNMVPFVFLSICVLLLFHFKFSDSHLSSIFYPDHFCSIKSTVSITVFIGLKINGCLKNLIFIQHLYQNSISGKSFLRRLKSGN